MKKNILLLILLLFSVKLRTDTTKSSFKSVSYYEYAYYELVRREGVRLSSYKCPSGSNTIGIGRVSNTLCKITLQQARVLAHETIQGEYDWVSKKIPTLTHNQKLACCLFIYNFGRTYFLNSDLYNLILHNKDPSKEWITYDKFKPTNSKYFIQSDNLLESRKRELKLFLNDVESIKSELPQLKENTILQYSKTKN